MKFILPLFLSFMVLLSCGEDVTDDTPEKKSKTVTDHVTNFSGNSFEDVSDVDLLQELDICVLKDSLGGTAECSPENFEILPFKNDTPTKDAFIVEIKAGIRLKNEVKPLPPVRHIAVYERINGTLARVNGFRGNFVGFQDGEEAKDIIVAHYLVEEETLFLCLYEWNGTRFMFKSIEGLDYGDGVMTLNASSREAVTEEVYSNLIKSNLIF